MSINPSLDGFNPVLWAFLGIAIGFATSRQGMVFRRQHKTNNKGSLIFSVVVLVLAVVLVGTLIWAGGFTLTYGYLANMGIYVAALFATDFLTSFSRSASSGR